DDLIDGDRWLNVQLQAKMNNGTIKRVNNAIELRDDVFADPQRLSPGNITIKKEILYTSSPTDVDTAVFAFPLADYQISVNPNGSLTVTHVPAIPADIPFSTGTDTLVGIERLQFTDQTINSPAPVVTTTTVPNVVALADSTAISNLTQARLGLTLAFAVSNTVAQGVVISQSVAGGLTR